MEFLICVCFWCIFVAPTAVVPRELRCAPDSDILPVLRGREPRVLVVLGIIAICSSYKELLVSYRSLVVICPDL